MRQEGLPDQKIINDTFVRVENLAFENNENKFYNVAGTPTVFMCNLNVLTCI